MSAVRENRLEASMPDRRIAIFLKCLDVSNGGRDYAMRAITRLPLTSSVKCKAAAPQLSRWQ